MRRVIVTAPGSLGDVNPMLAIAQQLHAEGREVLFLAAERYLHLAENAGLQTKALVSEDQFRSMTANPKIWHPRHGVKLIFREAVADFLERHYRWLEQHCPPSETLLVSHILDFAGRIFRDKYPQVKFASVLPAPALLRSKTAPPRLSSFFWEPWIPRPLTPLLYRLADIVVDRFAADQINTLRQSVGLKPVRRILHEWWLSPDLMLCMFPDWFSIPPDDCPPQMRLTDFPLSDSASFVAPEVTQDLQSILARVGTQPPIVFAPGTAHHHAKHFLQCAATACEQLGRSGILISSDESQFPARLPAGVVTSKYLPFSQLLPRASAIVHHGGVGTTSQAFAAGIPQVVVPMAFDQFDNACRVEALGCGTWFPMRRVTASRLAAALRDTNGPTPATERTQARMGSPAEFAREAVAQLNRLESSPLQPLEPLQAP